MSTSGMHRVLEETTAEIAAKREEIRSAEIKLAALEQIKAGVESYLGRAPSASSTPATPSARAEAPRVGPRGREAVAEVLKEHAGAPLSAQQVAEEVVRREWINPESSPLDSVRTALLRAMKHYPEVQRVGSGAYTWQPLRANLSQDEGEERPLGAA